LVAKTFPSVLQAPDTVGTKLVHVNKTCVRYSCHANIQLLQARTRIDDSRHSNIGNVLGAIQIQIRCLLGCGSIASSPRYSVRAVKIYNKLQSLTHLRHDVTRSLSSNVRHTAPSHRRLPIVNSIVDAGVPPAPSHRQQHPCKWSTRPLLNSTPPNSDSISNTYFRLNCSRN
jgi:hypothetical protein